MDMNVDLSPQLEDWVRAKVSSGLYASASDVVHEALRCMQEEDRQREAKPEALRRDATQGLESGPGKDGDAAEGQPAASAAHKPKTGAS